MERILIAGGKGTAGSIWAYIEDMRSRFGYEGKVEGFLNDYLFSEENPRLIRGLPVVGRLEDAPGFEEKGYKFVFGIHPIGHGRLREKAWARMGISMDKLLTIVHPSAFVSPGVILEPGVIVSPGCFLFCDATIGHCTFLASGVTVGHDSRIGSLCHISDGATISSYVDVGRGSDVCLRATILETRKVGDYSVIGSGALLTKDAGSEGVFVGVPARFLKTVSEIPEYEPHASEWES